MLSSTTPITPAVSSQIFDRIIRKRGRECSRCGGRHRDPQFRWCGPCRDLTAAYHKAYRHDHIGRKLCPECSQKKSETQKCQYHREYADAFMLAMRQDQRAKGLCGYSRCQNASDMFYCDEHRAKQIEYQAARRQRKLRRTGRRWAA